MDRSTQWRRWAQVLGGEDALDERLSRDGVDRAGGLSFLARTRPVMPPEGAKLLDAALAEARDRRLAQSAHSACAPFTELVEPFVTVARAHLERRVPAASRRVMPSAWSELLGQLRARLLDLSTDCLWAEFRCFRALGGWAGSGEPPAGSGLYRAFIAHMLHEGLASMLRELTTLARLLCTVTVQWVDASAALLERCLADASLLASTFNHGVDLGPITGWTRLRSTYRDGGQCVVALRFASGPPLIFKPRELALDQAFNRLLQWLELPGHREAIALARPCARPGYGWMRSLSSPPCRDRAGVRRFFHRIGALMALCWVLEGVDMHAANVIAVGEHPVLVDLESLLHPRLLDTDTSILRTGFLPTCARATGLDGLSGQEGRDLPLSEKVWRDPRTDRMTLVGRLKRLPTFLNRPRLGDTPARVQEHLGPLVEGFGELCRTLMARRAALLAPRGPLAYFEGLHACVMLRTTMVYTALRSRLLQRRFMNGGIARAIELEYLYRGFVCGELPAALWPAVSFERQAIERDDTPRFVADVDARDLRLAEGQILPGCFEVSALERARHRIDALDDAQVRRQIDLIHSALLPTAPMAH